MRLYRLIRIKLSLRGKKLLKVDPESPLYNHCFQLTETMGETRNSAFNIAQHQVDSSGYAVLKARLHLGDYGPEKEPRVEVYVGGQCLGWIPEDEAVLMHRYNYEGRYIWVQILTAHSRMGLRVDAFGWIGEQPPQWKYTRDKRPPVVERERALDAFDQKIRELFEKEKDEKKQVEKENRP